MNEKEEEAVVVATPKKVASYKAEAKKAIEPVVEPIIEPVVEPKTTAPKTAYAVVSGQNQDDVYLSKAIYKNMAKKRSLTVYHIQRRLKEWGHYDAYLDKGGFYGDKTRKSVIEFQDRMGIVATGDMDEATMGKLFEGDTNVIVHYS